MLRPSIVACVLFIPFLMLYLAGRIRQTRIYNKLRDYLKDVEIPKITNFQERDSFFNTISSQVESILSPKITESPFYNTKKMESMFDTLIGYKEKSKISIFGIILMSLLVLICFVFLFSGIVLGFVLITKGIFWGYGALMIFLMQLCICLCSEIILVRYKKTLENMNFIIILLSIVLITLAYFIHLNLFSFLK